MTSEIDQIVREVLRRLHGPAAAAASSTSGDSVTNGRELRLAKGPVVAADLADRLDGAERVVVPGGTVVTPAARDLLKARGVPLVYARRETPASTAATAAALVAGVAETPFEPAPLFARLVDGGIKVQQLARSGLVTIAAELADHVRLGGALGLLLTDSAAAALCLANRHRGVRAIPGSEPAQVQRDTAAVGANLLVVSPSGRNAWQLARIVAAFRGSHRECPPQYAGGLG